MFRRLFLIIVLVCIMSHSFLTPTADAQEQILGPWLWMIVQLGAGGGASCHRCRFSRRCKR